MKKQQLDHVLRAAGRITGESTFLIIGSQSLHGKHPDLPDDIARSAESDFHFRVPQKQKTPGFGDPQD